MAVTIKDVARLAGVSAQTVSNVMNSRPVVRSETREKVLDACARLGYSPNAAARSLVTRKRNIIGLVLVNIRNPIYADIVDTIATIADRYGYSVMMGNTKRDPGHERRVVDLMLEQRVDGVVLASTSWESTAVEVLQRAGIPVTLILNHPEKILSDYFGTDNRGGAKLTTSHLISLGHSNLAFVRGPRTSTSLERERGFRDAMKEANRAVNEDWVIDGQYTLEGGRRAFKKLLKLDARPTGIVCASDLMAFGGLDAAASMGISIPRELAVVGFDDLSFSSLQQVALTTVHFDLQTIAEQAIGNLLSIIDGEKKTNEISIVRVGCELIIRSTCGAHSKTSSR